MTVLRPKVQAFIRRFIRLNNGLSEYLGKGLIYLIPMMAILMNLVVIRRYGFGHGSVIIQEATIYLHASALMLGLAYTLKHNRHVRVDLLYSKWSIKRQALTNLVGHCLFLLPVSALMGIGSLDYVLASWRILESSPEAGGIPAVFLLKTLLPVSALTLFMQGLAGIGQAVLQLWPPDTDQ